MKDYEAHKAAKVLGQNRVNEFANMAVPFILTEFAPFIGQKVRLLTGGWVRKVNDVIENLEKRFERPGLRWNVHTVGESLWFEADICQSVPGDCSCHYMRQSFYVGEVNKNTGVLVRLNESTPKFKTDYDVATIIATLKKADELENEVRNLRYSVTPFENGLHGN